MGRLRLRAPALVLCLLVIAVCGCGGGSPEIQPPPPLPPDFSIAFTSNSVSVQQGATSAAVRLSITPSSDFSGPVQVTLAGLPFGVVSNPAGPFSVTVAAPVSLLFSAAANAATGSATIVATGTSGSLSHAANLSLTVQAGVVATLPRTTFARTDSVPVLDDPPGEPHHHHLAYDPAHQLLFVANRAMNRVDVFSTSTFSRVAQLSVPGASSADLSSDGATVWIGTVTEQVAAIDAASLQIKSRFVLPGLLPLPNTLFDRPEELFALSNGNVILRLRQSQSPETLLALWNPSSNSLTNLTSTEPQLFQNGLGAFARTGDRTKVIVAANDSGGELALYDSGGNVVAGPHGLGTGTISLAAANSDGSRFAVVFVSNGTTQVLVLDGSLNQIATYTASPVNGMVFSRDGQFLYVSENPGSPPLVTVLDGHSLNLIGRVSDLFLGGMRSELEDVDSTKLLFAIANRGIAFIDAASPASFPPSVPVFAAAPSVQPSEGPTAGGTATILSGQNFESSAQILFGTQSAADVNIANSTQISATSPPNAATGPVNVAAYFPSGLLALAPDAFSYGPQILQVLPNAGVQSGGDAIQIYGYGFGSDATKLTVTIGGVAAAIQKVENISSIASSLGLPAGYPFPIERITLQSPAGSAGQADIVVTSAAGSTTASKSFQYLQSEVFYAKPSFDKFILYDHDRQWLYLSNIDHVDIFDLAQGVFRPTGLEPPGGPPPTAEFRGLALTPDNSQLVAADFGSQNIYLFNPDSGSGSTVSVGGVPGYAASGPARVAATSTQNVFVGLSAESGSSGPCTSCLGQLNLAASPPAIQPASQPEISSLSGAPLVQSNANGEQVFVAYGTAPGGTLASWNASSPNQFSTFTANDFASDLAAASDGTTFAVQANGSTEIRAADLSLVSFPAAPELLQIPGRNQVPGLILHPTGALLYQPFLTGASGAPGVKGGIDVLDSHSGALRLRILLPQQFMSDVDGLHGSFLATDENGQRLFAITSTDGSAQHAGVTVITLAVVPLAIGTLAPPTGAAAGGTQVTIRGSGFQSGALVTIGGKSAAVTFKDKNTIIVTTPALSAGSQRVTITNPDGQTVSLDAAFVAN